MIARVSALVCARPRRVLLGAAAVLLLGAALGTPVVSILKSAPSDFQDPAAQNQRAQRTIEAASGQSAELGLAALVPSRGDARRNPGAAAAASRVAALLAAQPGFERALDYPASRLPQLVSRDGSQTVVLAAFSSRERAAAAVDRVRPELAGSGVRFGGQDIVFSEINKRTASDLRRAEMLAFPILLALSFWVFRGLIAATLPLLVGGFAILTTFLLLRVIEQFTGLSIFAVNLVTGMGLGLGIDYSLLVLSRYREELAAGGAGSDAERRAAIARTLQTAGRTVAYSSLTVAGALSSLLVFPLRFLYSMGVGGGLVALCAGSTALIVLPALLLALGPRIDALAPARLQRRAARAASSGERSRWFGLAQAVMRRPGAVALAVGAVLLVIALPALRLALAPPDARVLPASSQARQVSEALSSRFAADGSQTIPIVVHAPAGGARALAGLARRAQLSAGRQASVGRPRYLGHVVWELEVLPRGTEGSSANQALVRRLRALAWRSASAPGALLVGGATAAFVDQKAAIAAHVPLALAILALVTGGFLFLLTGSLVLPLLGLAMNLLTVAVSAGLLVLIFQDGHLAVPLGFAPIGGLEESNLVLLFVVAFALSTDYGVFLFARIKEAHESGLATRAAIAHGLERTGRLVTAMALLFCVAIGAFATSRIFFVKELGVGAALAVAIDASVVRALLVPALMGRLGDLCWWAPRGLRRLHASIGLGESRLGGAHA